MSLSKFFSNLICKARLTETGSYFAYIAQAVLKLDILLPQPQCQELGSNMQLLHIADQSNLVAGKRGLGNTSNRVQDTELGRGASLRPKWLA